MYLLMNQMCAIYVIPYNLYTLAIQVGFLLSFVKLQSLSETCTGENADSKVITRSQGIPNIPG